MMVLKSYSMSGHKFSVQVAGKLTPRDPRATSTFSHVACLPGRCVGTSTTGVESLPELRQPNLRAPGSLQNELSP